MGDRVLVVDDDAATCELIQLTLARARAGFTVRTIHQAEAALELVLREDFDVVVTDLWLGGMDGLALCARLVALRPEIPVVVLTGRADLQTVIDALRVGAYDFLVKPIDATQLAVTVARAARQRALRAEVHRVATPGSDRPQRGPLGRSAAMRRIQALIAQVAPSGASVLVSGETGTGKELIARAIHDLSLRHAGPFVAINCAAVSPHLIESELFGHVKGAFTDAACAHTGLFMAADGGTLFLDEVGEMPLEMQPKLLRALQERRVRPVGSNREVAFDVRIAASTNRDLEVEVRDKRFREDLYYRLNVVSLVSPPLRERGADILLLAHHFLARAGSAKARGVHGISVAAADKLMAYLWPGNVRELENCMGRAVALTRFDHVTVEDLPEKIRAYPARGVTGASADVGRLVTLGEHQRDHIARVLGAMRGNKSRAAKLLGLDRKTVGRKLDFPTGS